MDLTFAIKLLSQIEKTKQEKLKSDLFQKAIVYARIRTDCFFLDNAEKADRDTERTILHNSFIDSCNILSRRMNETGEDNSWRKTLTNDRKIIGDFASMIHGIIGIRMR